MMVNPSMGDWPFFIFVSTGFNLDSSRATFPEQINTRIINGPHLNFPGRNNMKKAKFTKQLTIMLHPAVYEQIRQITDEKELSIGEWMRAATKLKLEQEKQEKNNEFNHR